MLWEVRGTFNGREIKTHVEAPSAESARAMAAAKGVRVTKVLAVGTTNSAAIAEALESSVPPPQAVTTRAVVPRPIGHPAIAQAYAPPMQPVQVAIAMPPPIMQRGVSGFGIAALVIGIIAALICWIPILGMVAIPIAGIALFLAFIGFLVSLIGGHSGVGMSIAGGVTAAIALIISILMTAGLAQSISSATAGRSNSLNSNPFAPATPGISPGTQWTPATQVVQLGDMRVAIERISVGSVPLKQKYIASGGTTGANEAYLVVTVSMTNTSSNRKLSYKTWEGEQFDLGRNYATAMDDAGNVYKRVNFGTMAVDGQISDEQSIYPGASLEDVLVFEKPVYSAKFIHLELPAGNFGGEGEIRFNIPEEMLH